MYVNNDVVIFRDVIEEDEDTGQKHVEIAEDLAFAALMNGDIDALVHNAQDTLEFASRHGIDVELANLTERRAVIDMDEVEYLLALGIIDLHTPILLGNYYDDPDREPPEKPEICTAGRAVFNRILPDGLRFVQQTLDKKRLQNLVAQVYQYMGLTDTTEIVDQIKNLGFRYCDTFWHDDCCL